MQLIIDKDGKIEYSSELLKKGLNIIGNVNGVMTPGTFELRPFDDSSELSQISPDQINGEAIFISLKEKDYFQWISPDFSGICDVFFGALPNGKKIIGDNFFELLSQFPSVDLDKENISFFIRHGYFLPGKTFFKEISRVRVGNKLFFQNNNFIEKSIWQDYKGGKRDYQSFKRALLSIFICNQIDDNDVILLSGGCDSGLVAALSVLKFSKHPSVITLRYKQALLMNERDIGIAKKLTGFLGLKHLIPELDFNNESVAVLENYVKRMPLASHPSISFFKMVEKVKNQEVRKLWAGQNADSLYNLGPAGAGSRNILRRFYLSKNYIKSLPDVKDHSSTAFLYRTIGELGNLAFRIRTGYKTRQPRNFQELLTAFEQSKEYLSLPIGKSNFRNKSLATLTSLKAKENMFERKVQSFILGGDPKTIYASAENFETKAILPYAATNMMHFFRGLEMNLIDVLKPKRFIYRYLKELIGRNNFKKLYSVQNQNYQKKIKSENWEEKIVQNTKFGQELYNIVKNANLPSFITYNSNDLYSLISIYWLINVLKKAGQQL